VVAEGAEIVGERGDADAKLVDGLASLEGDVAEVPPELLRAGVARALVPDRMFLTASQASFTVSFLARVLQSSEGTERKRLDIASRSSWSSSSLRSSPRPRTTMSQTPSVWKFTFITNAHSG
jgi:hypothetical protein